MRKAMDVLIVGQWQNVRGWIACSWFAQFGNARSEQLGQVLNLLGLLCKQIAHFVHGQLFFSRHGDGAINSRPSLWRTAARAAHGPGCRFGGGPGDFAASDLARRGTRVRAAATRGPQAKTQIPGALISRAAALQSTSTPRT